MLRIRTYTQKVDHKGYPWIEKEKENKVARQRGDLESYVPLDWYDALEKEFAQPYFLQLENQYRDESSMNTGRVYPPLPCIFRALELCPLKKVSVVILGQDPYCRFHQANGLSFGVSEGMEIPPSLQNIFLEIERDFYSTFNISLEKFFDGDLSDWAQQGVLLLNTHLTVRDGVPLSHRHWGWDRFTDAILSTINAQCQHVVCMLWGQEAKTKAALMDDKKHLILTSAHPSPKSAHLGFVGCGHFVTCNRYLQSNGKAPIEWGKRKGGDKIKDLFT
jgi:uracil-DNA glycosylase